MTERMMRRRQVMRGAAVVAGGGAATGLGSASPAAASATEKGDLPGSWLAPRQETGDLTKAVAVVSFAAGGVLISHEINPAAPPATGTWALRSDNRFHGTFWTGFPGAGGPGTAGPTVRVRVEGRLHRGTIVGTYAFTFFDPSGVEMRSGTGTFSGQRINA